MFRPSSAACQDVSSFVRHPALNEREKERESVCVCINVLSFVWVMCCLDVSSVVSSLSRCLVFRLAPRVKRERERERERESVCVLMC